MNNFLVAIGGFTLIFLAVSMIHCVIYLIWDTRYRAYFAYHQLDRLENATFNIHQLTERIEKLEELSNKFLEGGKQ